MQKQQTYHFLLDLLQVFLCEGFFHVEIVKEALLNPRANRDLSIWKKLLHSHGQNMCTLHTQSERIPNYTK